MSDELRGRVRPDHFRLIKEAAAFCAMSPFQFALTAAVQKARKVLVAKGEFEQYEDPSREAS